MLKALPKVGYEHEGRRLTLKEKALWAGENPCFRDCRHWSK
ncbi:hypothetical protein [Alicyclobacillus tolerans]|uniref:Transposase n=1 Tax=Alicyclobacillus tolerans TaxID=90970 RepID=A0ABT9LWL6_9BACL|nr:hypothetical protein [Alicyclobacillus tengchongensis]MDP9728656.1 hypothetical protein [Alicyclobacillus tengchongensis]